jgi:hypothetical protein
MTWGATPQASCSIGSSWLCSWMPVAVSGSMPPPASAACSAGRWEWAGWVGSVGRRRAARAAASLLQPPFPIPRPPVVPPHVDVVLPVQRQRRAKVGRLIREQRQRARSVLAPLVRPELVVGACGGDSHNVGGEAAGGAGPRRQWRPGTQPRAAQVEGGMRNMPHQPLLTKNPAQRRRGGQSGGSPLKLFHSQAMLLSWRCVSFCTAPAGRGGRPTRVSTLWATSQQAAMRAAARGAPGGGGELNERRAAPSRCDQSGRSCRRRRGGCHRCCWATGRGW